MTSCMFSLWRIYIMNCSRMGQKERSLKIYWAWPFMAFRHQYQRIRQISQKITNRVDWGETTDLVNPSVGPAGWTQTPRRAASDMGRSVEPSSFLPKLAFSLIYIFNQIWHHVWAKKLFWRYFFFKEGRKEYSSPVHNDYLFYLHLAELDFVLKEKTWWVTVLVT